jgi:hypothetical protein
VITGGGVVSVILKNTKQISGRYSFGVIWSSPIMEVCGGGFAA